MCRTTTTIESSNKSNEISEKQRQDHVLFNKLVQTIRGYPFGSEELLGKDQESGKTFMPIQEALHQIKKSLENPEEMQNTRKSSSRQQLIVLKCFKEIHTTRTR